MKKQLLLIVLGLLSLNAISLSADDLGAWQSIQCGRVGDLTVRLLVKQQASLADEDWIAIEFDNQSGQDIKIDRVSYRIKSVRNNLETDELVSSGGMASGNDHALFPQAWKTTPVAPRIVRPGVYRMIDHPSLYSSALLGLPQKSGWLVKAEVSVSLSIDKKVYKFDKYDGFDRTEFEFQWLYPNAAEFKQMQVRLKSLLGNPRNKVQHAYILHTLLEIPEVAQTVSVQELLAALSTRTGAFTGRDYVLRYLNKAHSEDKLVISHFRNHLLARDKRVLEDLSRAPDIWAPEFLELLMKRLEEDQSSVRDIFDILRLRGKPQKSDAKLAQRLSAALEKHGWKVDSNSKQQPSAAVLASRIKMLGNTHDRNLVNKLTPFLDDKTETLDPNRLSQPYFRLPPLRVCDNALESILTILDGITGLAYQEEGGGLTINFPSRSKSAEDISAVRDKMIITLKARLAKEE
ncbi:MAG: hypothetical protein COA78_10985 [Blastopirellula sp.]|nr:MAG: hypothetical protein COA78_10985 [Blastopirellula sp.]